MPDRTRTAPMAGGTRSAIGERAALPRERSGSYGLGLAEHELVALWLLSRVPSSVLP